MYDHPDGRCWEFTARWQCASVLVGVVQLLAMNAVWFKVTDGFVMFSPLGTTALLIFNTVASAAFPLLCPLMLMVRERRKQEAAERNASEQAGLTDGIVPSAHDPSSDTDTPAVGSTEDQATSISKGQMMIRAATKWSQRARRTRNIKSDDLFAWLFIFIAICLNIVTWVGLQLFTYFFVNEAKSPSQKALYISCFNLAMSAMRTITNIPLYQADMIRIGAVEAEWHRYILFNRSEYAFAMYAAVFKFTLFLEIKDFRSFVSLAGTDLATEIVCGCLFMSKFYFDTYNQLMAWMQRRGQVDKPDSDSSPGTPALPWAPTTIRVRGQNRLPAPESIIFVSKIKQTNKSHETNSFVTQTLFSDPKFCASQALPQPLCERDPEAALRRYRAQMSYTTHCRLLATCAGAIQFIIIGTAIRASVNQEFFPHFVSISDEEFSSTIAFVALRW